MLSTLSETNKLVFQDYVKVSNYSVMNDDSLIEASRDRIVITPAMLIACT